MNELYKRICIELPYTPLELEKEIDIDEELNERIQLWSREMQKTTPKFKYRIINAETETNQATNNLMMEPAAIRFVVHLAYTV